MMRSALLGYIAAVLGSAAGVALWTALASATMRPVPFMALGVGILTGLGARAFLRWLSTGTAIWSSCIALFGCAAGALYSQAAIVSALRSTTLLSYVAHLPLFVAVYTFQSYHKTTDILWYALAFVATWLLAWRRTALPSAEKRAPGAAT